MTTDLVKVSSLNAVATLVRMITGFISVKIVAVLIGPSGVALLGQLNNFTNIIQSISAGGINTGVTKHIAQFHDSPKKYSLFLTTAVRINTTLSVICGLVLIVGAGFFSNLILKDTQYKSVFYIFGVTVILYALNALLVAMINGFREFKKYVTINIAGSLAGLLFTLVLSLRFGVYGSLVALVTYQSVIFFVTLLLVSKSHWFHWKIFFGPFSKTAAIKLGHYSLMALTAGLLGPAGQLLVRDFITSHSSLDEAGLWEGVNRISTMYLMIITTSFSVYYLPRLSSLKTDWEIREEVFRVYKFLLPFLFVTSLLIYLFRDLIIHILFDAKFSGMGELFGYQMIGNFFKMATWALTYLYLARAMTKQYILLEFVSNLLFVLFSIIFILNFKTIGATIGYAFTFLLTFIINLIVFRKLLFGREKGDYRYRLRFRNPKEIAS